MDTKHDIKTIQILFVNIERKFGIIQFFKIVINV